MTIDKNPKLEQSFIDDHEHMKLLFQDPYHGPGQAMGLSFSVPEGVKVPSSLVNIFKELKQDLGCSIPSDGNLEKWAVQVNPQTESNITSTKMCTSN